MTPRGSKPSWGRIGAASARETTRNDPTRPGAKLQVGGPFPPVSPGSETGVSGLIIRRSLVRVQPAPPFALVKSHILDLGAFQFDMTRSLLPTVLPIVHARQSFFRPPRACVASYRGTLGLRVHRWHTCGEQRLELASREVRRDEAVPRYLCRPHAHARVHLT